MNAIVTVNEGPDGLRQIVWDRSASANSFDADVVEQLIEAIASVGPETPVLTLTSIGKHFSGGFDLSGDNDDSTLAWRFGRAEHLLDLVRSCPAVTVALVRGPAFGLGADLAASCDYRVGDSSARFRFPGPRFGVVLGTDQLRERVGASRATDILMRNRIVGAEEARDIGLLTELLDQDDHEAFVAALAADVAGVPGTTRHALLAALRPDVRHASGARLSNSTHVAGLGERVTAYRNQALRDARPSSTTTA